MVCSFEGCGGKRKLSGSAGRTTPSSGAGRSFAPCFPIAVLVADVDEPRPRARSLSAGGRTTVAASVRPIVGRRSKEARSSLSAPLRGGGGLSRAPNTRTGDRDVHGCWAACRR